MNVPGARRAPCLALEMLGVGRGRNVRCQVEVGQPGHEGVTKLTEVRNVAHFLGEDVVHVELSGNLGNFEEFLLNPLAHQVFPEFNALGSLECHVTCLEDTCAVVVENIGRARYVVGNGHFIGLKPTCEVFISNSELATHVGGIDFSFTGAERRLRLTLGLPGQGLTHAEDDGAAHAATLGERNRSSFAHCVSNPRPHVGVSVSGESVRLFRNGHHHVFKCLEVSLVWMVKVGVHRKLGLDVNTML